MTDQVIEDPVEVPDVAGDAEATDGVFDYPPEGSIVNDGDPLPDTPAEAPPDDAEVKV
jgi:hypothetical protein